MQSQACCVSHLLLEFSGQEMGVSRSADGNAVLPRVAPGLCLPPSLPRSLQGATCTAAAETSRYEGKCFPSLPGKGGKALLAPG